MRVPSMRGPGNPGAGRSPARWLASARAALAAARAAPAALGSACAALASLFPSSACPPD